MVALGGVGHVGRAHLFYRLARFAFHGPTWHPIVAVLAIAVLAGANFLQRLAVVVLAGSSPTPHATRRVRTFRRSLRPRRILLATRR
jgi:hypothetical protein